MLEITRKYEAAAPRNPHALHMPTHIYTRLGDWDAVIRGNLRAAEAALEHPAGAHGELVWDEFATQSSISSLGAARAARELVTKASRAPSTRSFSKLLMAGRGSPP